MKKIHRQLARSVDLRLQNPIPHTTFCVTIPFSSISSLLAPFALDERGDEALLFFSRRVLSHYRIVPDNELCCCRSYSKELQSQLLRSSHRWIPVSYPIFTSYFLLTPSRNVFSTPPLVQHTGTLPTLRVATQYFLNFPDHVVVSKEFCLPSRYQKKA